MAGRANADAARRSHLVRQNGPTLQDLRRSADRAVRGGDGGAYSSTVGAAAVAGGGNKGIAAAWGCDPTQQGHAVNASTPRERASFISAAQAWLSVALCNVIEKTLP
jgi:hypothetical protein